MDPTTAGAVVFLAFTMEGCTPCKRLHADFAEDPSVQFVDAEKERALARQHNVLRFPTIIAIRDGESVGRHAGYESREILLAWMEKARRLAPDDRAFLRCTVPVVLEDVELEAIRVAYETGPLPAVWLKLLRGLWQRAQLTHLPEMRRNGRRVESDFVKATDSLGASYAARLIQFDGERLPNWSTSNGNEDFLLSSVVAWEPIAPDCQ